MVRKNTEESCYAKFIFLAIIAEVLKHSSCMKYVKNTGSKLKTWDSSYINSQNVTILETTQTRFKICSTIGSGFINYFGNIFIRLLWTFAPIKKERGTLWFLFSLEMCLFSLFLFSGGKIICLHDFAYRVYTLQSSPSHVTSLSICQQCRDSIYLASASRTIFRGCNVFIPFSPAARQIYFYPFVLFRSRSPFYLRAHAHHHRLHQFDLRRRIPDSCSRLLCTTSASTQ